MGNKRKLKELREKLAKKPIEIEKVFTKNDKYLIPVVVKNYK